jgi:hypothetical protein
MSLVERPSPHDVFQALYQLGQADGNTVYLQPAASELAISRMQLSAKQELGEPVPPEYEKLLRITNGVQINGAYFKDAHTLVDDNLDLELPEVIVLGNEGNVVHFVFDRRDRHFHTIGFASPGERFESYDSFEEMLIGVLKEQHAI